MNKIVVMMICYYTVPLCALEIELKNLSTSLAELQKSLSQQTPSTGALKTVETNQKTALAGDTADLKNTLKKIIDPHRVFSSDKERAIFYYFIIEESLNSAKVMELLAQKKYTAADLGEWYKQEKLAEKTNGALSQIAYKHYVTRDDWRPLPPVPGQAPSKSTFSEARELKEELLEVMQNIIIQKAALDSVQNKQTFKAIFDEALKAAMDEWEAAKG